MKNKITASPPPRTSKGRFQPGKSGNPSGRPKAETAELRQALEAGAAGVIAAVLQAAGLGDMQACKLVLDRVIPPIKPTAPTVHLPLPDAVTPLGVAKTILHSAAAGNIPPDVAATLIAAVGTLCRIEEVEELRDRIAALETAIPEPLTTKKQ